MTTNLLRPQLSHDPISAADLTGVVVEERHGGIVTFEGIVRKFSRGKEIRFLEYEAYPDMARAEMEKLLGEAKSHWPETDVALAHRLGRLEIGDVAVAIVAASPHRPEAFAACRFVIDELKKRVPIWKKEVAIDGEEWIEDQP